MRLVRLISALILLPAFVAGCGGGSPPARGRLGGLPFPGAFTLFRAADPDKLGHHRFDQGLVPLPPYETDRGLVYTCEAGFVDLAHLRGAADWTRYFADHLRDAIKDKEKSIDLAGPNYSRFTVKLRYPDDWGAMKKAERARVIDELAVRMGQRTAYAAMTWHEVITWYGFRGSIVFDESPSSFTWDDVMSHVIGIRVGGAAWRAVNVERRKGTGYNRAVTEALAAEIAALRPAKPDQTVAAARAVEGRWWRDGKPLRRQLDVGLTSGRVTPWRVPGLPFCADPPPSGRDFALPELSDVAGRDFRGLCSVEISPRIGQAGKIAAKLPGKPKRIDVDRDLPALVEAVRRDMLAKFGEGFDRP
jgi:hypothetical protein